MKSWKQQFDKKIERIGKEFTKNDQEQAWSKPEANLKQASVKQGFKREWPRWKLIPTDNTPVQQA